MKTQIFATLFALVSFSAVADRPGGRDRCDYDPYGSCVEKLTEVCEVEHRGCFTHAATTCKDKRPGYAACVVSLANTCRKSHTGCYNYAVKQCE